MPNGIAPRVCQRPVQCVPILNTWGGGATMAPHGVHVSVNSRNSVGRTMFAHHQPTIYSPSFLHPPSHVSNYYRVRYYQSYTAKRCNNTRCKNIGQPSLHCSTAYYRNTKEKVSSLHYCTLQGYSTKMTLNDKEVLLWSIISRPCTPQ